MAVVIYHYFYFGPAKGMIPAEPITIIVPYLQLAVETFFIISGFVILFSAEKKTWGEFAIGRFSRLGPTLLICSTITYAAAHLFSDNSSLQDQATIQRWIASIAVAPLIYVEGVDWSIWSLKFELIFYASVTALIATGLTSRKLLLLSYALLTIHILYLVSWTFGLGLRLPMRNYAVFFALGTFFYLRRTRIPMAVWLVAIITALYACAAEFEQNETVILKHIAPSSMTGGLIAGIVAISLFPLFLGTTRNALVESLCSMAGRASFPLYVVHQFVGYVIINRLSGIFPNRIFLIQCVTLVSMVLFAIVVSTYVEKNLMRLYRAAGTALLLNARKMSFLPQA
jgi:peptidoglycan/LPS O-acetylase OafA/YrhL